MTLNFDEPQVRARLSMPELIDAMEDALAAFSRGEVDQPVRSVVEVAPGRGFLGVMPAHIRTSDSLGAKLVTVFQGNHALGLPGHQAVILLFDANTGSLDAVMDGRYITEARTAAVSAVSVKLLAQEGARRVGILGSGVQARSHVEALSHVIDGAKFRAWSPNRARLEQFCRECGVTACAGAREAVDDADIIVTATAATEPVLESAWVKAGAHVAAVGACRPYHRELDPALVARSRLFVDSRAAAVKEAGDVVMGGFEGHIAGELGELLSGKVEGRTAPDQVTVFKSLGLAVEDVAAARLVWERRTTP